MWKTINEIRGKEKRTIKPQFCCDGTRITERRLIANKFNEYFASIASKLNDGVYGEIRLAPIPSFLEFMPKHNEKSIFLSDCSTTEISEIIASLKSGKASDC